LALALFLGRKAIAGLTLEGPKDPLVALSDDPCRRLGTEDRGLDQGAIATADTSYRATHSSGLRGNFRRLDGAYIDIRVRGAAVGPFLAGRDFRIRQAIARHPGVGPEHTFRAFGGQAGTSARKQTDAGDETNVTHFTIPRLFEGPCAGPFTFFILR
jgi:hypothetical protein